MTVEYRGEKYPSLRKLCNSHNIDYQTCYRLVTEKHVPADKAADIILSGGSFISVPYTKRQQE